MYESRLKGILLLQVISRDFEPTFIWFVEYCQTSPNENNPLTCNKHLSLLYFWLGMYGFKKTWIEPWPYLIRNKTFLFFHFLTPHVTNQDVLLLATIRQMKFCEVSRNKKFLRFWKFQLSILTSRKVLFLMQHEIVASKYLSNTVWSQKPYFLYFSQVR